MSPLLEHESLVTAAGTPRSCDVRRPVAEPGSETRVLACVRYILYVTFQNSAQFVWDGGQDRTGVTIMVIAD
jgi:hypothetical protein